MKQLYILIFSVLALSCSEKKIKENSTIKNDSISINDRISLFNSVLNKHKLQPTFTSSLDSLSYFDKNLKIETFDNNEKFKIAINDNKFEVKKLQTLNDVWNGKDSLSYSNQISQIKYYKNLDKVLLLLNFDMCTGLGCSVYYQIIYDLKTKNIQPFGRFRTGDDMDIYEINGKNYFLSKTFHGRNAQLKDTIFYDLFRIEKVSNSTIKPKRIAKFTFENENYDKPISFKSFKIK